MKRLAKFFDRLSRWLAKSSNDKDQTDTRDKLTKYVEELHTDYEVWYAKSVRKIYRWWWLLQGISLLSGFAFAVISALVAADVVPSDSRYRKAALISLIVLPALSALAANGVLQFRIYDLWRLREYGRIEFQNLVVEGQRRLEVANLTPEQQLLYQELQKKAHEIESEQMEQFFALTKSDFVSKYQGSNQEQKKQSP